MAKGVFTPWGAALANSLPGTTRSRCGAKCSAVPPPPPPPTEKDGTATPWLTVVCGSPPGTKEAVYALPMLPVCGAPKPGDLRARAERESADETAYIHTLLSRLETSPRQRIVSQSATRCNTYTLPTRKGARAKFLFHLDRINFGSRAEPRKRQ